MDEKTVFNRECCFLNCIKSGSVYMPSCMRPEIRLPLDQRVLCSDCCKKCGLLGLAQVIFSYFVLHSSKIPLVLTTKVTH